MTAIPILQIRRAEGEDWCVAATWPVQQRPGQSPRSSADVAACIQAPAMLAGAVLLSAPAGLFCGSGERVRGDERLICA